MRAIDAAAVEALCKRWCPRETLDALLATAVEAEPVGEGDGLRFHCMELRGETGRYFILQKDLTFSVFRHRDACHKEIVVLDPEGGWSRTAGDAAEFPTLPAARAALAAALKAGEL